MNARRQIDPGWKWDDRFNLSQAIQIGDSIYTSGQVAIDAQGNVVGKPKSTEGMTMQQRNGR